MPDYFLARPPGTDSYGDTITRYDLAFTVTDVADRGRHLTPRFAPRASDAKRQRAVYSDTNFQLLGAVVEAVTADRFHQVVAERVLTPLSLDSSCSRDTPGRSVRRTALRRFGGAGEVEVVGREVPYRSIPRLLRITPR